MTESEQAGPPSAAGSEADEIRVDIEVTRTELADTVDALSDKLDVKARAGDKVADAKAKVAEAASQAMHAAPEPVKHALDQVGEKAGPVVHNAAQQIRPYRKQLIIGALVAAVTLRVIRKRHGGES